jgi:rod shape-determining protein MreD
MSKIKPLLWVLVLAVMTMGLQLGAFQVFNIKSVAPNLMLALVVSVSLCQGSGWGIVLALVLGAITDALTGWGMGLNMLQWVIVAGIAGLQELRMHADRLWLPMVISAGGYVICTVITWLALYISRVLITFHTAQILQMVGSMLLTSVCACILHLILYRRLQPVVEDYYVRNLRIYR